MYNLIAGISYYFDDFSSIVVGEILKAGRNEDIDISRIETSTGICKESLISFFGTLMQCGLLTDSIPTAGGIMDYRQAVLSARKSERSWVDKSTKEKLPMEVSKQNKHTSLQWMMERQSALVCLSLHIVAVRCVFIAIIQVQHVIAQRLVIESITTSYLSKNTSALSMICMIMGS